eukprot:gene14122-20076_t
MGGLDLFRGSVPAATIDGGLELKEVVRSSDGTRKLVFKLTHGEGAGSTIETVLIPVVRESGSRNRITLCVSSQVGCAMNCQFCFTGRMGLLGNLTTAQIVQQVVEARKFLAAEKDTTPMTNLVFMGMGEPLHNMEAVLSAISIVNCSLGLHLSINKITMSTVGLVDELREFTSRSQAQVALSLHATTDEVRSWIVPVNRRHDLASLMKALAELFPRDGKRIVLIEYVMLRGINDTEADATRLVELLSNVEAKVNLIAFNPLPFNTHAHEAKVNLIVFNPHKGTRFQPSENEQILGFRSILIQSTRSQPSENDGILGFMSILIQGTNFQPSENLRFTWRSWAIPGLTRTRARTSSPLRIWGLPGGYREILGFTWLNLHQGTNFQPSENLRFT